jgi:hypothetical protein
MPNVKMVVTACFEGASGIFTYYERDSIVSDANGKYVIPLLLLGQ